MKPKKARPRPKRPRGKRSQNKEKTKRAILKAALELFAEKGFYAATTKAISKRAGTAEGTLFNYFETKEDLALYYFEEELTGVIDWYDRNASLRRASLAEQLFAIVQRFLDHVEPYEEFIGAVYLRALAPGSRLSPWSLKSRERQLRYLQFIRRVLARAEEDGEIPRVGDFGAYAFSLFHLAMITHWLGDCSPGKQKTLALLDRCLKMSTHFLTKGGWNW